MREFNTGATRNIDNNKLDFEGFFSPLVIEAVAEHMHVNRKQADGTIRDSDNWQRGIPRDAYMKSLWRHFFDVWKWHRGLSCQETLKMALCGVIFNASGYLHELIKKEKGL